MDGVDQWEQNMLAIGPSTVPYSRGNDNRGLFTTLDVTRKGTILCIKKGINLNKLFWSFSDYSTSDIRIISSKDKLLLFYWIKIPLSATWILLKIH